MKLLADEGVDREVVESLRGDGHTVTYIAEAEPGLTDEEVLSRARAQGAILITQDKDFGDLVFRQGLASSGIVLLRLMGLPAVEKGSLVAAALRAHEGLIWRSFTVVSATSIRIRAF